MKEKTVAQQNDIVLYKDRIEVRLEKDTVWLTQAQMSLLFGTKRPAVTKHLSNIFKSHELDERSVCSILEHTAKDGKTYAPESNLRGWKRCRQSRARVSAL